jgi:predicted NAD-dependent protein-ADP-ribosyltransferase YbiA (DUF1768 family)
MYHQGGTQPGSRQTSGVIKFYDKADPYYEFTNFSDHPIRYGGKDYPTSEHLFQSLKVVISSTLDTMMITQWTFAV